MTTKIIPSHGTVMVGDVYLFDDWLVGFVTSNGRNIVDAEDFRGTEILCRTPMAVGEDFAISAGRFEGVLNLPSDKGSCSISVE